MKKIILFLLTFISLFVFSACGEKSSSENKTSSYEKITAEKAKDMFDEGAVLVDVRTEAEYLEKRIPNAILIPNETIKDSPPAELSDFDENIIVYCRSGNRSASAAQKLADLGYNNVYDLGGIIAWTYETESGEVLDE